MNMMKKFIPATLWILALSTILWSCEDGGETPTPTDNALDVRSSFVSSSNSALSQLRSNGFSGPIGAIFGNRFGGNARTAETPSSMMRARTSSDTTDVNYCFTETWEEDGQGNYRFTLDFGDGCDYYGSWMYGKMEEIGSYTDSSYSSAITYTQSGGSDREGGADWWVDGTHSYTGTWSITQEEGEVDDEMDSVYYYNYYETTYQFDADLTQTYIEYIGAPEDSVTTGEEIYIVDYVADGSEKMDESGYTVLSRNESVSANTGESYTSTVDTPLFLDYECEDVWIFVTGIESGTYEYEGETGTYSIDYGDGTCDNIIAVTENGQTEEIDLGEEWEEWEEECGEDHED